MKLFKISEEKKDGKHVIIYNITTFGWAYFYVVGFFKAIKEYIIGN